jgi:hypothetical protein
VRNKQVEPVEAICGSDLRREGYRIERAIPMYCVSRLSAVTARRRHLRQLQSPRVQLDAFPNSFEADIGS